MKLATTWATGLLSATLFSAAPAFAGSTDLQYLPGNSSAGHDFNHAPVGQSFTALAAKVKAGLRRCRLPVCGCSA